MEETATCAICGVSGSGVIPVGGHAICPECQRLLEDPANRRLTDEESPVVPQCTHSST